MDLFVALDGASTLALVIDDDEDLAHAGVRVDREKSRIVVRYAAEHPLANAANRHFDESLRYIEAQVEAVNSQVAKFNEGLEPAVVAELERCKVHAEERKTFAAGLKLPDSYERWWGRPVESARAVPDDRGAGPLPSGPAPRRVWLAGGAGHGPRAAPSVRSGRRRSRRTPSRRGP